MLWLACAFPRAAHASPQETERERAQQKRAADPIAAPLERRLRGKAGLEDVLIEVRWPKGDELPDDCRIYGNGVGIWKRQAQFRLAKPGVLAQLRALKEARFAMMPHLIGEGEGIEKEIRGWIVLSIGQVEKKVVQLDKGDQSRELQSLASKITTTCETTAAKRAVRVSSFDDAFGKLSSGELAPEALELMFHRKTLRPSETPSEDWSLRINGRRVTDRDVAAGQAPLVSRELTLTDKEFGELLRVLREGDLAEQRPNLYAVEYTDFRVRVLNKIRGIQARQFVGLTAQTHGERQQAFDRMAATLVAIHRRARSDGKPVPSPPLSPPEETRAEKENE